MRIALFERPYDPYVGGSGYRKKMDRNGLSGMQKRERLSLPFCFQLYTYVANCKAKEEQHKHKSKKSQILFILIADTSGSHLLTSSGDDEMLSLCAGRNIIIYLD